MIASLNRKFAFLHIPKNAGKFVRAAIKDALAADESIVEGWGIDAGVDLAHPFPETLSVRFPMVFELLFDQEATVVAILRDPVSRCISAYMEHRIQYGGRPESSTSIGDYLDNIEYKSYRHANGIGHLYIHGAPQREFLFHQDRIVADTLLSIHDDVWLHKLAIALGRNLGPFPANRSGFMKSVPLLGKRDILRIVKIYSQDYELLEEFSR